MIWAIELDNCLSKGAFGVPNTGVKTLLDLLPADDYILIHTRCVSEDGVQDSDEQKARVEDWLKRHCIRWDSVWALTGKPVADVYVETLDQLKQCVSARNVVSQSQ